MYKLYIFYKYIYFFLIKKKCTFPKLRIQLNSMKGKNTVGGFFDDFDGDVGRISVGILDLQTAAGQRRECLLAAHRHRIGHHPRRLIVDVLKSNHSPILFH